jgi:hypothetical protein
MQAQLRTSFRMGLVAALLGLAAGGLTVAGCGSSMGTGGAGGTSAGAAGTGGTGQAGTGQAGTGGPAGTSGGDAGTGGPAGTGGTGPAGGTDGGGTAGTTGAGGRAGTTGSGGRTGGGGAVAGGSGGALAGTGGSTGGRGGASGGRAGTGAGTAGSSGASGSSAAGSTGTGGSGSTSTATIVPPASWACGLAAGIAPPASGDLVFKATLQVSGTHDAGMTQYGHRRILDISGGSATGTRLTATFLKGGFDFELTLSNGAVELEQIDILKASDGTPIYLRSCGVAPAGASEVRIVPDFEVATSSSLAWLNTGKFAGTRVVNGGTMEIDVYDISKVTAGDPKVTVVDPGDHPAQPWDCNTMTGSKGSSVFTENVTLGSSVSIGASKRGTRNIIPITGGTVTGRLMGTVLNGGGDYQLVGGTTKLDARYVLQSSDGVFVVVRNCGPIGSLVPWFETRTDGAYAFLNTQAYVSSDPGSGSGGVSITFYDRK